MSARIWNWNEFQVQGMKQIIVSHIIILMLHLLVDHFIVSRETHHDEGFMFDVRNNI
jgi:hypothetical protein